MNRDINSLNPNVNVTNHSVGLFYQGVNESSNVHEGREYTDLTNSNSLEESCEKTCIAFQEFEDDFDFDLDIPFNLEGMEEIENLEEQGQQELAVAQELDELGLQQQELGVQQQELGTQHEVTGTHEETLAVETEEQATQEQEVVQEKKEDIIEKEETRTEELFNESEMIATLFGGFNNIFIDNGIAFKDFPFLNEHLQNASTEAAIPAEHFLEEN